eukprot:tig00020927_g15981.t1
MLAADNVDRSRIAQAALAAAAVAVGVRWLLKRGRGDLDSIPSQLAASTPAPNLKERCALRIAVTELCLLKLDWHMFLRSLHDENGDSIVRARLGSMEFVSIADPEVAREVLSDIYNFVPAEQTVWQYFRNFAYGIITFAGEKWRRERRVLSPAFHPAKIPPMHETMVRHTGAALEKWSSLGVVDLREEFPKLALDVISSAAFGADVGALAGRTDFSERLYETMTEIKIRAEEPVQLWRVLPTPRARRFAANARYLRAYASRLLEERRRERGQGGQRRGDMLEALLDAREAGEMDAELLIDEAMSILIAGNDTSSSTLSFACAVLAAFPALQDRCRQEAREVLAGDFPAPEELERLPYITAFLKETLRLFNPPTFHARQVGPTGATVAGRRLPPGIQVWVAVGHMHYSPKLWGPDAEEFKPERFLPGGPGEECRGYMPFSTGQRSCPGRHLAMAEMRVALASLVRRYRVEPEDGKPSGKLPGIVTVFVNRPKDPVRVRLVPLDGKRAAPQGANGAARGNVCAQ